MVTAYAVVKYVVQNAEHFLNEEEQFDLSLKNYHIVLGSCPNSLRKRQN